ncbi:MULTISPECIES: DUF6893 family small protein [Kitasatospora]
MRKIVVACMVLAGAGLALAVAQNLPDIKRYLQIRRM